MEKSDELEQQTVEEPEDPRLPQHMQKKYLRETAPSAEQRAAHKRLGRIFSGFQWSMALALGGLGWYLETRPQANSTNPQRQQVTTPVNDDQQKRTPNGDKIAKDDLPPAVHASVNN